MPSDAQLRSRAGLLSMSRVLPMDVAEAVSREMWDAPTDRFRRRLRADATRRAVLAAILELGAKCGPAHQETLLHLAGVAMSDALTVSLRATNPGNADKAWAALVDGCDVAFCRAIGAAAEHVPELQDADVTSYAALRARDRVPPEEPAQPARPRDRVIRFAVPIVLRI